MKLRQDAYQANQWRVISESFDFSPSNVQLVLAFGERTCLENVRPYEYIRKLYPRAAIVISSASGEIYHDTVHEGSIIVNAIEFERTIVRTSHLVVHDPRESKKAGVALANGLLGKDLAGIFILSDGLKVNGSALIAALNEKTEYKIPISGGLSSDNDRFERTLVGLNENPVEGKVVAIGLYGNHLKIGHGTMAGWDGFGIEREVTESKYNVIYRIGDKAALDLYKDYLGKYANELPNVALLFPISIRINEDDTPVVRTIISIDETQKTMTLGGDIPVGASIRFMKANLDRLIDASSVAAQHSLASLENPAELALLVSCEGRKIVLGRRVEEEVEATREIFGEKTIITGFYSYGGISSQNPNARCELHNQTMTITTFSEN